MESDDRLSNRLAWVTGLRLGFLTLLFGATAFFYLRGALGQYPHSQAVVLGTIGTAFALAAVYAGTLRRNKNLRLVAEAQIVLDQLTWTAIVYVTGGATSGAVGSKLGVSVRNSAPERRSTTSARGPVVD